MRSITRLLAVPLLGLLGACNMAISDTPLFVEADRSPLQIKNGYWLVDDGDCRVDTRMTIERWPVCAEWALLRSNVVVGARNDKFGEEYDPELFIVAGKPLIVQLRSKPRTGEPPLYQFVAIAPTAVSPDGHVTATYAWIIQCGDADKAASASGGVKPYPGFDADCRPRSIAALRTAAEASRANGDEVVRLKWVRAASE